MFIFLLCRQIFSANSRRFEFGIIAVDQIVKKQNRSNNTDHNKRAFLVKKKRLEKQT